MTSTATVAEPTTVPDPPTALDRLWLWLFVVLVAVALPLLLFHYGAYHWFLRAEWQFLADRGDSRVPDLLKPHGGAHWVAVPRLLYLALWQVFGMTTYRPYQAVVVVMHLTVAVLLRVVMRRAGVRPVLATAAAAVFVLCGPGAVNTVWAFQVSFTGSMMWGLAHLLLADHDGPADWRDLLGLGCGLLAITSSGIGVTTAVAVGVAVLLRRGWRLALLHTVPLALVYGGWLLFTDGTTRSPTGRSQGVAELMTWVRDTTTATFGAVGRFDVVGWLLAVVLVVGVVLLAATAREEGARAVLRRHALPIGLAVAALFFAATTGTGRAWLGGDGPRSPRYLYLEAAFVLPLLATAAEAIAQRWRALVPALAVLFVLPIPFNLQGFDQGIFGEAYMRNQERILTTAVRMPFARDVPRDVQPVPDVFASDAVTIGFLLTAEANGKLEASSTPLTPELVNEFKVRLGVAQRQPRVPPGDCRQVASPHDLSPERGDVLHLGGPVVITTAEDGAPTSRPVPFNPQLNGSELTIELPDLDLQLRDPRAGDWISLCEGPAP